MASGSGSSKASAKKASTKKSSSKKTTSKKSTAKKTTTKTPNTTGPYTSATTSALSRMAMNSLNPVLDGLRVNDLNSYVSPNSQVRKDFIRDENYIRGALENATNRAFDLQRAQALQDAANAEDANYRNTQNAIAEMRRNLVGSASSGANVGAANATALQALLGIGQQNANLATEGLRNVNNVSRERSAQLAQNALDAINTANDATGKMYDAATSSYAADRSYAAQGAAEAVGQLAGAVDTNASQERQTSATNAANERMNAITAEATKYAARKGQKSTQTIINKKK